MGFLLMQNSEPIESLVNLEVGKYDSMSQELKDYANKRIKESGIVMVPGHYPVFDSKEHVDEWIKMMQAAFTDYFGQGKTKKD